MLNFNLFLKLLFSKTENKNNIAISIMIVWIKCNRKTLHLSISDCRELTYALILLVSMSL